MFSVYVHIFVFVYICSSPNVAISSINFLVTVFTFLSWYNQQKNLALCIFSFTCLTHFQDVLKKNARTESICYCAKSSSSSSDTYPLMSVRDYIFHCFSVLAVCINDCISWIPVHCLMFGNQDIFFLSIPLVSSIIASMINCITKYTLINSWNKI